MASQDINLADSWVCRLVSQKMDEIANESYDVCFDEEADYGEEAAAASSHAAQTPPRKKIRIRASGTVYEGLGTNHNSPTTNNKPTLHIQNTNNEQTNITKR